MPTFRKNYGLFWGARIGECIMHNAQCRIACPLVFCPLKTPNQSSNIINQQSIFISQQQTIPIIILFTLILPLQKHYTYQIMYIFSQKFYVLCYI